MAEGNFVVGIAVDSGTTSACVAVSAELAAPRRRVSVLVVRFVRIRGSFGAHMSPQSRPGLPVRKSIAL